MTISKNEKSVERSTDKVHPERTFDDVDGISVASHAMQSVAGQSKKGKRHMKSFLKPSFVSRFLFDKQPSTKNCDLCGAKPGECKHK